MGRTKLAGWWLGSLLACAWTASAQAQTCEQNSDCPKGLMCTETVSDVTCAAAPCTQGQDCAVPPECMPTTQHQCVPANCERDSDCAADMVCYEHKYTECPVATDPGAGCAPNEKCELPAPAPAADLCTETTLKQCTPRFTLPCEQDNDCGTGFSCIASQECSCSGSAGRPTPTVDGGTAPTSGADVAFVPAPLPVDGGIEMSPAMPVMPIEDGGTSTGSCECHPSAIKHCELKEIVCGGDNDCPSNFACTTIAVAGTSSCAATDGPDASTCEPASMIVTEEKRCMPRYFNDYGGKGTAAQAGSDSGGTVSTSGMGESKPAGTTPPTTPNAPDAGAADDDQTTDAEETATDPAADNAGCSVSHPGQQGSQHGYLAGLFLMALGLRARRRPR